MVAEEDAPAAKQAVRLAVAGLVRGLPPADAADSGTQASMLNLCRMLRKERCWEQLELLAAGPCVPL